MKIGLTLPPIVTKGTTGNSGGLQLILDSAGGPMGLQIG